jgi:hypothetical protein
MNGTIIPSAITMPFHVISAKPVRNLAVLALLVTPSVDAAYANVVTDWDEKAMDAIQGNAPAPPAQIGPIGGLRIATIMHIAIFQAVNTIDPRYEPYQGQATPKVAASEEAAATAAAATVLIKLLPAENEARIAQARDDYLAAIPEGEAKSLGVKLGNEAAIKAIASRTMRDLDVAAAGHNERRSAALDRVDLSTRTRLTISTKTWGWTSGIGKNSPTPSV